MYCVCDMQLLNNCNMTSVVPFHSIALCCTAHANVQVVLSRRYIIIQTRKYVDEGESPHCHGSRLELLYSCLKFRIHNAFF